MDRIEKESEENKSIRVAFIQRTFKTIQFTKQSTRNLYSMKQFGCPIVEKVTEHISVVELYLLAYQRLKLYLKTQQPSYLENYYENIKNTHKHIAEFFTFAYKNEHVQNAMYMPTSNDDAVAGISHPYYGFVLRIVNQVKHTMIV